MLKILLGTLTIIASQNVFMAPAEAQKKSAREQCCIEMKGLWRADGGGRMLCYSLGRGAQDAYYKCVEKKGG